MVWVLTLIAGIFGIFVALTALALVLEYWYLVLASVALYRLLR